MKNCSLIVFALFVALQSAYSQVDFGVKGGVNITFFKITEGDFGTNPDTETGFYGGFFADFNIDEGFHIQPEVLYKGVGELEFINAPIYLKYDISRDFHILIGPSLNYFFDLFTNKFKVRADVSLDYDLGTRLSLHMKYTLGFEELSPNILFLGLGYRL
ncbi:outer membrane beta-barrel protein [Winogradskyella alexanderae]|uniref:PorT family protein n=1 Tax=Winogradskyella alexanderae TaxID=2877123 RepID=A0ABS7XS28_9FLAO|nr:outer membrane beta-barrel protein [Winogradskyella alexanderae]MCA0131651.1 PorT family protein [Winogradskyella alexanderae]